MRLYSLVRVRKKRALIVLLEIDANRQDQAFLVQPANRERIAWALAAVTVKVRRPKRRPERRDAARTRSVGLLRDGDHRRPAGTVADQLVVCAVVELRVAVVAAARALAHRRAREGVGWPVVEVAGQGGL